MLRLYTQWELERELSSKDFQHILTPEAALAKAAVSYDLDYRNYTSLPFGGVPRKLIISKDKPYTRAESSVYDPVYDDLEMNLMEGWIIGLDTDECWDDTVNPFHINANGALIFDSVDVFCWDVSHFHRVYQTVINNQNGRKPAQTEMFRPFDEPLQHAQAAKTISSKAAGRLLAAGGIYNGNIEGFHKTAQQLGGDASAGYDQVMDNKGLLITGASIAAGLSMGRINPTSEIKALEELNTLSATTEKIGGFSVSELSRSAGVIDKGSLTKAGRALQKHGDRIGSIFPKATGEAVAKNAQGQSIVDSILKDPKKTVLLQNTGRFGQVIDIMSAEGKGLRYDSNGNLIGFLEPPK